jgi:hypothetical protein
MDFTSRNVIALAALEECEHLNMEYQERFNAADAFELSDRKFVKIFRLKKHGGNFNRKTRRFYESSKKIFRSLCRHKG